MQLKFMPLMRLGVSLHTNLEWHLSCAEYQAMTLIADRVRVGREDRRFVHIKPLGKPRRRTAVGFEPASNRFLSSYVRQAMTTPLCKLGITLYLVRGISERQFAAVRASVPVGVNAFLHTFAAMGKSMCHKHRLGRAINCPAA